MLLTDDGKSCSTGSPIPTTRKQKPTWCRSTAPPDAAALARLQAADRPGRLHHQTLQGGAALPSRSGCGRAIRQSAPAPINRPAWIAITLTRRKEPAGTADDGGGGLADACGLIRSSIGAVFAGDASADAGRVCRCDGAIDSRGTGAGRCLSPFCSRGDHWDRHPAVPVPLLNAVARPKKKPATASLPLRVFCSGASKIKPANQSPC